MKKIILAAFMAACGLQMSAQQNLFVAQDLESAIVNKDNTVTFNFKAPDAKKVQIAGDFAEKDKSALPFPTINTLLVVAKSR